MADTPSVTDRKEPSVPPPPPEPPKRNEANAGAAEAAQQAQQTPQAPAVPADQPTEAARVQASRGRSTFSQGGGTATPWAPPESLPKSVADVAKKGSAELEGNPGQQIFRGVVDSAGFGRLDQPEQTRLLHWARGDDDLGNGARYELEQAMGQSSFRAGTADDQATALRQVMKDAKAIPGVFDGPVKRSAGVPYEASRTGSDPAYPFETGAAPADLYGVKIDGRTIPLAVGAGSHPGMLTPKEAAIALSNLNRKERDAIHQIIVEPKPSADDLASAQTGGILTYYAAKDPDGHFDLDGTTRHEAGHLRSFERYGPLGTEPGWDAWKRAMAADHTAVSVYARTDPHEDFAEHYQRFREVRGTPLGQLFLERFPNRTMLLERDYFARRR